MEEQLALILTVFKNSSHVIFKNIVHTWKVASGNPKWEVQAKVKFSKINKYTNT